MQPKPGYVTALQVLLWISVGVGPLAILLIGLDLAGVAEFEYEGEAGPIGTLVAIATHIGFAVTVLVGVQRREAWARFGAVAYGGFTVGSAFSKLVEGGASLNLVVVAWAVVVVLLVQGRHDGWFHVEGSPRPMAPAVATEAT